MKRWTLAKITKTEVQASVAEMRSSGVPDSAIRRRFSVFRSVMVGVVEAEPIVKSLWRGANLPKDRRGEIEVLTPEEVAQLAEAIPAWCRSWVWTAAYFGAALVRDGRPSTARCRPIAATDHRAPASRRGGFHVQGL